ncbi:Nas2p ASCRUDRAFT_40197 [Ascoidea rubescens DSM 1968]|uniref:Nas2 N-terminal domain-containing protein n=1 Tax=Ascoidea rubescens DSM 1968 TaxID=1344418 RepID=A0A1D2V8U3_9ASCO|nr:hypothetical protein ASCRUDRAFT_40197 [Ascoidea rubescens DSM 1968]ODV57927.1 hypothetical protein ASCRUDRAFT_40197 [Ascoidea rubescens DSM 1968]
MIRKEISKENNYDILDKDYDIDKYDLDGGLSNKEMIELKGKIEEEIKFSLNEMKVKYKCDMESKMIDEEGFPRGDIDIYEVILIRKKVNYLQNDLRKLMGKIEAGLVQYFSSIKEIDEDVNHEDGKDGAPFLKVIEVLTGSPGSKSGLIKEDKIIRIDQEFDFNTFDKTKVGFKQLNEYLQGKEGKKVELIVLREKSESESDKDKLSRITLELVPSYEWEGQGLLGCRLVAL